MVKAILRTIFVVLGIVSTLNVAGCPDSGFQRAIMVERVIERVIVWWYSDVSPNVGNDRARKDGPTIAHSCNGADNKSDVLRSRYILGGRMTLHEIAHVGLEQADGHRVRFGDLVGMPSRGKVVCIGRTVHAFDKIE